jgi:fermentation-respiration switch protein FrsA (DUF1100 family)
MGAVAAIQAASRDSRIEAVIAVSPFATLRETIDHRLRRIPLLTSLVAWWGKRLTGLDINDLQPVDVIASIAPRPILIMQAGDDRTVTPDCGRRLYKAAAAPKALWSVPGVAHVDFRQAAPDAYKQRVISFFERYLPLKDNDSK